MENRPAKILQGALQIGDELLASAKHDTHGVHWSTLSMDNDRNYHYEVSDSLYNGCAGIALFLFQLGKVSGENKYMKCALAASTRLASQVGDTGSSAFYTGRIGLVYLFIELNLATKNDFWIKSAEDLARSVDDSEIEDQTIDDVINGNAGTLLVLLHLHQHICKDWLQKRILRLAELLVKRASISKGGLYWDRTYQQISGLCGFSHGAGGIGFVFLELGRYFKNKEFYQVAQLAFSHERKFFSRKLGNWQDLRRGFYNDEEYKRAFEAYLSHETEFFTKGSDMNAWCHGAAGIGFSRLLAVEVLDDSISDTELKNAVKKTIQTNGPGSPSPISFTLCHAAGGNLDLLLEVDRIAGSELYGKHAEDVAIAAIDIRNRQGYYVTGFGTGGDFPDNSLFMGNAGIGYFYLRVLNKINVPSILNPRISGKHFSKGGPKGNWLKKQLLNMHFQESLRNLQLCHPDQLRHFFLAAEMNNLHTQFFVFCRELGSPILNDILRVEKAAYQLDISVKSAAYNHIRALHNSSILPDLLANMESSSWKLSDEYRLITSKYYQPEKELKSGNPPLANNSNLLLRVTSNGIVKDRISDFSYFILGSFKKEKSFSNALQDLLARFGVSNSEEREKITSAFKSQMHQAVSGQVLLKV